MALVAFEQVDFYDVRTGERSHTVLRPLDLLKKTFAYRKSMQRPRSDIICEGVYVLFD